MNMRTHALFAVALISSGLSAWSTACSSDDPTDPVLRSTDASTSDVAQTPIDSGGDTGLPIVDAAPPYDAAAEFLDCADAGVGAPQLLKCTGLYGVWSTKTLASSAKEYAPAYPLWSDDAVKTRWAMLPAGQKIDTTDMDEWTFPVGTKFWKQFVVDGKKIETRFYWKADATTWFKATYKWNAAETEATRFDTGEWAGADGGDASSYEIPSVGKCTQCHNGRKDEILGFEAVNLGLPGATGITLASLVAEGRLTTNPPATALTIPEDTTGLAAPALGWMHTNCGITCHSTSPGATCGTTKNLYLRLGYGEINPSDGGTASVANLTSYTTSYNIGAALGAAPNLRIAPGNPNASAISYLIGRREPALLSNGQMPPIASHTVDAVNVAKVNAWITALP